MSVLCQKQTSLLGRERLRAFWWNLNQDNEFIATRWNHHFCVRGFRFLGRWGISFRADGKLAASAPLWFVFISREEGGMFGSLGERLERRQRLQRRIDLLVRGTASPGSKDMDADPVVSGDMEAAIEEAFRRGQNQQNFIRHRHDR